MQRQVAAGAGRPHVLAALVVAVVLVTSCQGASVKVTGSAVPTHVPSAAPADPGQTPSGAEVTADVVVYGATPSGIMAAVSAADTGASVALLASGPQVGGMMTSGLGHADAGRRNLIGGLTAQTFQAIGDASVGTLRPSSKGWDYEPHVAAKVFEDELRQAGVAVYLNSALDRSRPLGVSGGRIRDLVTTSGRVFRGKVYIDASYEGDLMAAAGVPFAIGRESPAEYGEPLAGQRPDSHPLNQLVSGLDAQGQWLPGVSKAVLVPGAADGEVQASTFRLCVTDNPANRIPFTPGPSYDPAMFALVGRAVNTWSTRMGRAPQLSDFLSIRKLSNGDADLNSYGLYSTDVLDGSAARWITGSDLEREAIWASDRRWVQGLLWYLETDPGVPAPISTAMANWGLCGDEFLATGNWPPDLYIREARRMLGGVVIVETDAEQGRLGQNPIALAGYRFDAHFVQRTEVAGGLVGGDGQIGTPTLPFGIPYGAIVPPAGSVDNLIVSVTISASHVAWSSVRTEPTLMEIGEAAGDAAAIAANRGIGVREVPYAALEALLLARGSILTP